MRYLRSDPFSVAVGPKVTQEEWNRIFNPPEVIKRFRALPTDEPITPSRGQRNSAGFDSEFANSQARNANVRPGAEGRKRTRKSRGDALTNRG